MAQGDQYTICDNTQFSIIDLFKKMIIEGPDGEPCFKTCNNSVQEQGIQGFFLEAKGEFGTGGGWADSGFLDDTPMLLFNGNNIEKAIYMFFASERSIFDNIDPLILFIPFSTTAPSLGNEDVRLQLTCRYIAEGEATSKVPDEVLLITHTLTDFSVNTRQPIIIFQLDRTKISISDVLSFKLERLPGDALDTYNGNDLGIGQSGVRQESLLFNP